MTQSREWRYDDYDDDGDEEDDGANGVEYDENLLFDMGTDVVVGDDGHNDYKSQRAPTPPQQASPPPNVVTMDPEGHKAHLQRLEQIMKARRLPDERSNEAHNKQQKSAAPKPSQSKKALPKGNVNGDGNKVAQRKSAAPKPPQSEKALPNGNVNGDGNGGKSAAPKPSQSKNALPNGNVNDGLYFDLEGDVSERDAMEGNDSEGDDREGVDSTQRNEHTRNKKNNPPTFCQQCPKLRTLLAPKATPSSMGSSTLLPKIASLVRNLVEFATQNSSSLGSNAPKHPFQLRFKLRNSLFPPIAPAHALCPTPTKVCIFSDFKQSVVEAILAEKGAQVDAVFDPTILENPGLRKIFKGFDMILLADADMSTRMYNRISFLAPKTPTVPFNISAVDLKAELERAKASIPVSIELSNGLDDIVFPVGNCGQTSSQITKNVMRAIPLIVDNLPFRWNSVRRINLECFRRIKIVYRRSVDFYRKNFRSHVTKTMGDTKYSLEQFIIGMDDVRLPSGKRTADGAADNGDGELPNRKRTADDAADSGEDAVGAEATANDGGDGDYEPAPIEGAEPAKRQKIAESSGGKKIKPTQKS